jgi:formiminoglutamase
MGASLLMARYSRFAIDLNRPEDDTPLYQSATTGLFRDILFDGTSIFHPGAKRSEEVKRECKERIWRPYHGKLMAELNRIKGEFGHAVPARRALDPRRDPAPVRRPAARLQHRHQRRQELRQEPVRRRGQACDTPGYRHVLNGRSKAGTSPATTASRTARSTPCSWSWRNAPT